MYSSGKKGGVENVPVWTLHAGIWTCGNANRIKLQGIVRNKINNYEMYNFCFSVNGFKVG